MDVRKYKGKRVLVTGHTGFKGSWLCLALSRLGSKVCGYALAPEKVPNLYSILGLDSSIKSVIGDIRDGKKLLETMASFAPEIVIHMAAQALVGKGYAEPCLTYETNSMGTVHLMEAVRKTPSVNSVVVVTTDKVYQESTKGDYREDSPLDGYDPYANSKTCAELITATYRRCYLQSQGVAVSTCRAGNAIGGGDFCAGRIIPDCVASVTQGKPLVLRNPESVRPYQHVLEPITAYLTLALRQAENIGLASAYNIGPADGNATSTMELAKMFFSAWGEEAKIACEEGRHKEAQNLTISSDKIKNALGIAPKLSIQQAVDFTVDWYKAYYHHGDARRLATIQTENYIGL